MEKRISVEDLRSLFAGHQETYLPVSPPSEEVFVQDYGPAVPFRTANLPKGFLKRMVGELNADLVPVYRLSVYEDPATRETVFLNVATGREMYRLAPAKGYRPLLRQRAHFGRSPDPLAAWIFDPAHIAADFTLVPEAFYADYVLAEERARQAEAAAAPAMKAMSAPAEEAAVAAVLAADAGGLMRLTAALPPGFGDHAEIFRNDNLARSPWVVAANRIPAAGTAHLSWTDPDSAGRPVRFYMVSDPALDGDGDGYSDLRERHVTRTDPAAFDSVDADGDGLHDWHETMLFGDLSQTGADDYDGDTLQNGREMLLETNRVVFLSDPTLVDTDGDGMGDAYEAARAFLDPFDPADAEGDCDNDGTSNLDEHNQGTDPGGGSAGGGGSGSGETNVTVDVRLKVGEFRYVYKTVLDGEQTFRLSSERKGQTKTGTFQLKKGETYTFALTRTNKTENMCGDYPYEDYVAEITGDGILVDDPNGVLGDRVDGARLARFFDDNEATGSVHIIKPDLVYVSFGDGSGSASHTALTDYFGSIGAEQESGTGPYVYEDLANTNRVEVRIVGESGFVDALGVEDAYVAFEGHANYGIGLAWNNQCETFHDFLNVGDEYTGIYWPGIISQQPSLNFRENTIVTNPENHGARSGWQRFANEAWTNGVVVVPEVGDSPPNNVFTNIYGSGSGRFHYKNEDDPYLIMRTGTSDMPALNYKWLMLFTCHGSIYYSDSFNYGTVFSAAQAAPVNNVAIKLFVQAVIEDQDEGELLGELQGNYTDANFEGY